MSREGIKNMRTAIIFALTATGCSEEICLAIENAYIRKARKYFSLISRKPWRQFRRRPLSFITRARNNSHPRRDATRRYTRIDVPSRENGSTLPLLPLSIWWITEPFMASILANNRRSSSFSFLPKKTMIAIFSFVLPSGTQDPF